MSSTPLNVSASQQPGINTVLIQWQGSEDAGSSSAVTYTISYNGNLAQPATISVDSLSLSDSTYSWNATFDLVHTQQYTFTVMATNADGSNSEAASAPEITFYVYPEQVGTVYATAGYGLVTVSWALSVSMDAVGYEVFTADGTSMGTFYNQDIISSDGILSVDILNLVPLLSYSFQVAAFNDAVSGLKSAVSNSATPSEGPFTVPDAPTNVVAVAGNGSVTLSWEPPSNDGGSMITTYIVTYRDGTVSTGSRLITYVMTGLTNGESYTFTITASNSIGDSLPSNASNTVTPSNTDSGGGGDAPTIDSVIYTNNTTLLLNYTQHANDTTLPSTCRVQAFVDGSMTTITIDTNSVALDVTNRQVTLSGLTAGSSYVLTLALGTTSFGTASQPYSVANLILSVANSNTQTLLVGTALTDIVYSTTAGATNAVFQNLPPGVTGAFQSNTVTISGSPNAVGTFAYTVTLNGSGASANGTITVLDAPSAPSSVTLQATGDSSLTFAWSTVTGAVSYAVSLRWTLGDYISDRTMSGITGTSYEFTELLDGVDYVCRVVASSATADSASSPPSLPARTATVPTLPTNVSYSSASAGALTASCAPVADLANNTSVSYTAYFKRAGAAATYDSMNLDLVAEMGMYRATRGALTGGVYEVYIGVRGDVDQRLMTTSLVEVGVLGPPSAPFNVTVTSMSQGVVTFAWSAPTSGYPLDALQYTATLSGPGGSTVTANTPLCSVSFALAITGGVYALSVTASNDNGVSAASTVCSVTNTYLAPPSFISYWQTLKAGSTVADLVSDWPLGLRWYRTNTDALQLSSSEVLVSGREYWATQTVSGGHESEERTRVRVRLWFYEDLWFFCQCNGY